MSDRLPWRCPLFSFTLSVFLVACSGSGPIDDTGSSGDTAQDTDTDTDTGTDKNASLTGVLVWTDGSAAEGLQVRLCYSSC
ncbi:MAG: hypothetical protein QGG40_14780, partial [Myxococcota bacterium]|nr:hypothetical protein [Myxococcota bacterium]